MTGQFDYADSWLNMADALASRGRTEDAAKLLQAQVARHPGDYKLWVGLGNALTDHARTITPAGRLAYLRAAELAPGYPAPKFFLGLAEARSGNPEEALRLWREVLADAPPKASWRPMVEDGISLMTRGAATAPQDGSGRLVGQIERFGDGLVADLAAGDVEAVGEMRVLPHRFFGAEVRKLDRERQRRIVECKG